MERKTVSTCPFCGVGCGIVVHTRDDRITWVDDDPANPSSRGMLCVKGRFGIPFVQHPDRLTTPLVRRDGELQPASWDEALDLVAERLLDYRGAFGSFASAKATNEDAFVQQKFVRLVMGTNNIDHCTRLCHSPSVEAMLVQLGSGATSNSYIDYEEASCLVVVGCDPDSNHPVIASRMRKAVDDLWDETGSRQPEADRPRKPGRRLPAARARDRCRPVQRHGPRHPRRGARRPRLHRGADGGVRSLAGSRDGTDRGGVRAGVRG
jgi:anaerobic selenocysteine-containing dehydrogenase